jgi:hypothetical protein
MYAFKDWFIKWFWSSERYFKKEQIDILKRLDERIQESEEERTTKSILGAGSKRSIFY